MQNCYKDTIKGLLIWKKKCEFAYIKYRFADKYHKLYKIITNWGGGKLDFPHDVLLPYELKL